MKRYREMMGIKQQTVATDLGQGWTQKKISRLEDREVIEKEILEKVSKILNVPMDTLKNKDPKALVNIQNNYEGSNAGATDILHSDKYENCTFNPLDEIKQLNDQNKELYERLLASEKEKVTFLQQMLDKLK